MALTGPFAGWMRNYEAMGNDKLQTALAQLRGQYGDAHGRVMNKNGMLFEHLREAEAVAFSRGLIQDPNRKQGATDAATMGLLTDPMECSECGRVEKHYADDYICRTCRDAVTPVT